MKIVIVSDTHGKHADLGTLEGDVLIHCGDFSFGGREEARTIEALDAWFSRARFGHILCTGGNHDFHAETAEANGRPVFRHATYLADRAIVIDGVKFYGAPWIPELSNWAHYRTDVALRAAWARIPNDTDVLITHTPPLGVLDRNSRGKACGCAALRRAVDTVRPRVHCFGHVHASAGTLKTKDTTYVNASVVNRQYEISRAAVEIEISAR